MVAYRRKVKEGLFPGGTVMKNDDDDFIDDLIDYSIIADMDNLL